MIGPIIGIGLILVIIYLVLEEVISQKKNKDEEQL